MSSGILGITGALKPPKLGILILGAEMLGTFGMAGVACFLTAGGLASTFAAGAGAGAGGGAGLVAFFSGILGTAGALTSGILGMAGALTSGILGIAGALTSGILGMAGALKVGTLKLLVLDAFGFGFSEAACLFLATARGGSAFFDSTGLGTAGSGAAGLGAAAFGAWVDLSPPPNMREK